MKIQVDDLAKQSLIDIYYYNYQYSLRIAIETKCSHYRQSDKCLRNKRSTGKIMRE